MARRTPLYPAHVALGARIIEFGGWDMPLSYSGATEEHQAVRRRCGLFDVSHMGEVEVRGPEAAAVCQHLTANDVSKLRIGDAQYSLLCNERGGVIDDLVVLRTGADRYVLIVNAANTATDVAWITERSGGRAEVVDRSAELGLLALQGPESELALRTLTPAPLASLRPFAAIETTIAGRRAWVSRTGYTGEDGFELLLDAGDSSAIWGAVLEAVRRRNGLPAGLGARDSLRLEAGLPLHGSDVDADTSPLEAGLAWVVKLGKGDFIGRAPLAAQAESGPPRRLVAFEMGEAAVPRHDHPIWHAGAVAGTVTSGMKSPTLGTFIGLGYVTSGVSAPATPIAVEIRGRQVPARIVERPFYRRVRQEQTR
jgi:aminomethyltransferase